MKGGSFYMFLFLIIVLTSCYPKVDKDLSKGVNTATTDIIFRQYLLMGEAISKKDSVQYLQAKDQLQFIAWEFPEDIICRIHQILRQKKSQQEIYFSLTLQIQKILNNSQGIHFEIDTMMCDKTEQIWFASKRKNLQSPYN